MENQSEIKYKKVVNEEKPHKSYKGRLFKPKIDPKLCEKCMLCVVLCPEGCIKVSESGNPSIDHSRCKGCLICLRECRFGAIGEEKE